MPQSKHMTVECTGFVECYRFKTESPLMEALQDSISVLRVGTPARH